MILDAYTSEDYRCEWLRTHYLSGNVCDYVPVFTINNHIKTTYNHRCHLTAVSDRFTNSKFRISELLFRGISNNDTMTLTYSKYLDYINKFEISTHNRINDSNLDYYINVAKYNNRSGANYNTLNNNITEVNLWKTSKLRSGNYLTNLWFAAKVENDNYINPLFCLMTKRECIPYLRLCGLFNEAPDPAVLELWVKSEMVDRNTIGFKNFRSNFKKNIESISKSYGIATVEKKSLYSMFNTSKVPKFDTLTNRRKWIAEQGVDAINHIRAVEAAKVVNIELI